MRTRLFKQIDVFSAVPYRGNALAVVLDGTGLTHEEMLEFTHWTNLSEATFLLPPSTPEADYRVRIYCPGRELPFAGHPTLGSCHAWLEAGGKPRGAYVVQECGVGLVRIRREGQRLAFAAPPLRQSGPLPDPLLERVVRGLGIQRSDVVAHAWCVNGPSWLGVLLRSAEQVLAIKPDGAVIGDLDVGVVGPFGLDAAAGPDAVAFEVRAFFPGNSGLTEDPVTGSLNAALAQWLIGAGLAPARYVAAQGTVLGRAGRVYVEQEGADIWIGGDSVTCIEGMARL